MDQSEKMQRYYRFHARIYQATRWTFLFGRRTIIQRLKLPQLNHLHLVEVGCGTGHNLHFLATEYPGIHLTGIDIAPQMLEVATRKLKKFHQRVDLKLQAWAGQPADIVLFSYCLTMINPGWEQAIADTAAHLPTGSRIAVVDFHRSRFRWFERWMGVNHVRMDGHLLPELAKHFRPICQEVHQAYFGFWEYLVFVGEKR